ncbi:MAG: biotin--[acetyl-CoA-carboxylase] ligase [Candidatus Hydrogenedentota bacterium]|nr:MAG: biotin--[acetyl-CoA-carboxylase] ligase [Candidatus Hydrogenedentota bacterium]
MTLIVLSLPTCKSTNSFAFDMINTNPALPVHIIDTPFQTAGRGRSGRSWHSTPFQDFTFTCVVHRKEQIGWPVITATYLLTFFEEELSISCSVKWPNDILYNGKKLAGILCEKPKDDVLLIGIGININSENALPEAISLKQILSHPVAYVKLKRKLFLKLYQKFYEDPLLNQNEIELYKSRLVNLNSQKKIEGYLWQLIGIDSHGFGIMENPVLGRRKVLDWEISQ